MRTIPVNRRAGRGFTLVEMLVVITIIGILAGLAVPAVIVALRRVKIGAIKMELSQLEMACQAYKDKFGEYPPDFAFALQNNTVGVSAKNIVVRHLAKAFPRYTPGIKGGGTGWAGFLNDLSAAGIDTNYLTPQTALIFWLGGMPTDPTHGNFLPSGLAADVTNPFQTAIQCPSRISPFFDFDPTRSKNISSTPATACVWAYWPQGAVGNQSTGAITYFRAENGAYTVIAPNGNPDAKSCYDAGDTTTPKIFAAFDTRTSNVTTSPHVVNWVNPKSVQIFSAGMDTRFGNITPPSPLGPNIYDTGLQFPTGENYLPYTYDDITNFSSGTLEDSIP
jgi:prepilin-type N-terminal cleavage/methylation domain-containing protein